MSLSKLVSAAALSVSVYQASDLTQEVEGLKLGRKMQAAVSAVFLEDDAATAQLLEDDAAFWKRTMPQELVDGAFPFSGRNYSFRNRSPAETTVFDRPAEDVRDFLARGGLTKAEHVMDLPDEDVMYLLEQLDSRAHHGAGRLMESQPMRTQSTVMDMNTKVLVSAADAGTLGDANVVVNPAPRSMLTRK